MSTPKQTFHGSDLEKIEAVYGIKKEEIISFSANVNPLGISTGLKASLAEHLDAITTYPERDYASLRKVMSAYTGVHEDSIIPGSGSTELLSLFIRIQHPKKAIIVGPTYSEYEREITLGGGTAIYYPLTEADDFHLDINAFCGSLNDSLDLCVLCNPNNPTGSAIRRHEMRRILDSCMQNGIFVMVDETYVEFAENLKDITALPLTESYQNLIVMRGTSKFFAAPGLRLGYAVTGNKDVRKAIDRLKNPWTINSLAEVAGRIMFMDHDYIQKTRELISTERARLTKELASWGTVKVYPTEANFVLFKILKEGVDAQDVFEHCIHRKLMIRNCASFAFLDERFVRFCFMMPDQNDLLLECMGELLKDH